MIAVNVLTQAVVNGLLIGGVYALVAVGLNLMFGVMKLVNFAHGEFLMMGMYVAVSSCQFGAAGRDFWASIG